MAALAASRNTISKLGGIQAYLVKASTTVYKGAMVALDANGFLVPATNAANQKVVGVAEETVVQGASATLWCRVDCARSFLFNATSITQAMVGTTMYVVDDNTFDDAVGAASIIAGVLMEFIDTTHGYIWISQVGGRA